MMRQRVIEEWSHFVRQELRRESLMSRIAQPYLRARFDMRRRAELLIFHYRILRQCLPAAALADVLRESGVEIAALTGKSGRRYALTLGTGTSKEGELNFSLLDVDKQISLATLRVVIGTENEMPVLWIGGLQGAKPPFGRAEIVQATRDLNGLRPKHAVLQAAAALCSWLGIRVMLAPSRANHISQRGWRRWRRKRRIHADYNAFWREFGAFQTAERDFVLILPLPRRLASQVVAKRRKEWARRMERLDNLTAAITTLLNGWLPPEAAMAIVSVAAANTARSIRKTSSPEHSLIATGDEAFI